METFDRRHPHHEILQALCRVECDGDGVRLNPLVARAFLSIKGFDDIVEQSIAELVSEGELVERTDPLHGERMVGVKEIVARAERAKRQ